MSFEPTIRVDSSTPVEIESPIEEEAKVGCEATVKVTVVDLSVEDDSKNSTKSTGPSEKLENNTIEKVKILPQLCKAFNYMHRNCPWGKQCRFYHPEMKQVAFLKCGCCRAFCLNSKVTQVDIDGQSCTLPFCKKPHHMKCREET